MVEQDIPALDESIIQLPSDIREDLAARGRNNLFFFNKAVLGFKDMTFDCHGPICAFADLNPSQFKLFLQPRDHLKTHNLTIGGTMQKVVRNSEERVLIANESATNAERMLRAIRQQAESNRVFRALYSDCIHKDIRKVRWNDSELDFVRKGFYPEPSIDAIGMTGAVTSRHYTHITYDDPISEEAVKSEKVMTDTIARISAALSLLVDPNNNTIWFVGTRWALHDVYSFVIRTYGNKLARIVRAAIENGQPIWPERFSLEILALKRAQMGEYKFSCLMMNNPRNVNIQDLNVDDVRWWAYSPDESQVILYDIDMSERRRLRVDELDITTTVDLAAAEKATSDRNAIVTVGTTAWNEALVLDVFAERCSPLAVIDYLIKIKERFSPRVFGIEDVGYQKTMKVFLRQELASRGLYMNIQPIKANGKKEARIRGLQPYMATGRLYLNASQHILRSEMADFPLGEHDDALDALSMHTQLFRGQMAPAAREKYRESEEILLNKLRRGISEPAQMLNKRFDSDIELDEFTRPQFPFRDVMFT